jgi:hypothetical protein
MRKGILPNDIIQQYIGDRRAKMLERAERIDQIRKELVFLERKVKVDVIAIEMLKSALDQAKDMPIVKADVADSLLEAMTTKDSLARTLSTMVEEANWSKKLSARYAEQIEVVKIHGAGK